MKKIELSEEQVQILINAQAERIKELEKKIELSENESDFEWRSMYAFRSFIETLGEDAVIKCIKYIYQEYGQTEFVKDTLEHWHEDIIDISKIKESGDQFESWPNE